MADEPDPNPAENADLVLGANGTLEVRGHWTIPLLGKMDQKLRSIRWPDSGELVIDGSKLEKLDTAGAWLIRRTVDQLEKDGRKITIRGMRPEFESILKIVSGHEPEAGSQPFQRAYRGVARLGQSTWKFVMSQINVFSFVGESAIVAVRGITRPHRIRWHAFFYNIQAHGFDALPIAGLLVFLMGVVIAYQGAEQLRAFGANIFIVDLVGISMLREIAPIITAIIVAGRSGSAFAAQIGTMKVTEEVDALRTIGIPPMELLVLPKVLALVVALPLLTVYADVVGVFGGMLVAKGELEITFPQFLARFRGAIELKHYLFGILKAPVFATIIALVGSYQGFLVSGSANSVGKRTTTSVVMCIFLVIVVDAIFSVLFRFSVAG